MMSTTTRTAGDKARWTRDVLEPALRKAPERKGPFTTISGRAVERLYAADDVDGIDLARDIGQPGDSPMFAAFTRAATAASCGRCVSLPASGRPRRPTPATRS
jgi:hypothetical protein